MLIDTHAHLTDEAFNEDFDQIIENAKEYGVEKIITSGYNLSSSKEALNFAENHEGVFASIGIYPENAEEYCSDVEKEIILLAQNKKVVAIGEIGLQYTDGMPEKNLQKEVFVKQLKMADRLNLPIVLHCRDAFGDMILLLKENKNFLNSGGTFHCFSGSLEIAQEAIKLGLYISIGGVSTFKNATKLQEIIKEVPLEKIILETDCPYLAPAPFRGQRNQPAMVRRIAENLSVIKGVSIEDIERVTTENARRLFKI